MQAILQRSRAVSIGIAVWLWLSYIFTPLAPFYFRVVRILNHGDDIRFDMYQLHMDMSISNR